jgi:hypothetical protein
MRRECYGQKREKSQKRKVKRVHELEGGRFKDHEIDLRKEVAFNGILDIHGLHGTAHTDHHDWIWQAFYETTSKDDQPSLWISNFHVNEE